ncbi:hypothetical protein DRQ00_03995 [candidate division KSB1 bacterium]|nr:MAG: hypothetical protein DRQ00_03995 [candidate division KSB1 bacterium]RKY87401.1 MAG: hypothetical protein DRQ11_06325 [candidate division KSB1 bacterium]HDI51618.1 CPBP family intramembrane metalloprotease [Bacteroidota bacterium]
MFGGSMQSPRSSLSILSAIVIVVFSILMLLIIGTLVSTFLLRTDSGVDISRSPVFFLEILLVVPAAIMLHKQDCPLKKGFRLNRVNSQLIGASVIVGLSGAVLADELDRLTQLIFPVPKFFDEALKEGFRYSNTVDFFLLVLTATLLAGIVEEMLFRGFLQRILEQHLRIGWAILGSAILFAFLHFIPWWFLQITILGIVLGFLAYWSNSIIPSTIVHIINNGVAIYLVSRGERNIHWYLWHNHVCPPVLLGAALLFSWGLILARNNRVPNEDSKSNNTNIVIQNLQ